MARIETKIITNYYCEFVIWDEKKPNTEKWYCNVRVASDEKYCLQHSSEVKFEFSKELKELLGNG